MVKLLLNGASERQGLTAMGISLVCQGVGILLAALLAGQITLPCLIWMEQLQKFGIKGHSSLQDIIRFQ